MVIPNGAVRAGREGRAQSTFTLSFRSAWFEMLKAPEAAVVVFFGTPPITWATYHKDLNTQRSETWDLEVIYEESLGNKMYSYIKWSLFNTSKAECVCRLFPCGRVLVSGQPCGWWWKVSRLGQHSNDAKDYPIWLKQRALGLRWGWSRMRGWYVRIRRIICPCNGKLYYVEGIHVTYGPWTSVSLGTFFLGILAGCIDQNFKY